MRDGTILRATIYHLADDNKYPTLLCLNPSQKQALGYVELATTLAARGFTVEMQHQRGRYA